MAASKPKKPTTVLIVEDEAVIRFELAARLKGMGLVVLVADGADDALSLLETHPEIRVLFTDVMMAGSMDGVRLANQARRRWPPVKIIVTSGLAHLDIQALPEDCIFLPKPYAPDQLTGALTQLLAGGRPHAAGGWQRA
jgi:CheY-like chemotaxis protein